MNRQEENPSVEVDTFEGKVVYEFTAEDDPPPSSARRAEDGEGEQKKKKKKKKVKKVKKVKKPKGSNWTWFLAQTLLLSLVSGLGIYYVVFLPSIVPSVTTAGAVVTGGTNSTIITCSQDKKTCNLFNHASGNVYYMTNPRITRKTDKCLRIAWKDQGMQLELSTCEPGAMRESILKEIPS